MSVCTCLEGIDHTGVHVELERGDKTVCQGVCACNGCGRTLASTSTGANTSAGVPAPSMSGLMCAPLGHDHAVFHTPRRFFRRALSGKQNQWAYLNKRYKAVPFLGSFHITDVFNVYELTDYLVNFVTAVDPNGPTVPAWPTYTTEQPNLMTFADGLGIGDGRETGTTAVTQDTFRDMSAEERLDRARRGLFRSVERPRTSSLRGYRSSRRPAACVGEYVSVHFVITTPRPPSSPSPATPRNLYAYGVCKEKY
ncbi:hypothetical protein B0H14DRAFT_3675844 [Mycena olivaceomarginata]|nr:hypothetical protein B0H14DRAFT_3675844 [Mycena olivaceomarginata]